MARGKFAAKSAIRRAEAAEMTADRYIEQSMKWKQIASQNKALAELARGTQKELSRLRAEPMIPRVEHERIITEMRDERAAADARFETAACLMVTRLAEVLASHYPQQAGTVEIISVSLLNALRQLPESVSEELWTKLGWERKMRRAFADPGFIAGGIASHRKESLELGMMAQAAGLGHDRIPASWVRPRPGWAATDDEVAS